MQKYERQQLRKCSSINTYNEHDTTIYSQASRRRRGAVTDSQRNNGDAIYSSP